MLGRPSDTMPEKGKKKNLTGHKQTNRCKDPRAKKAMWLDEAPYSHDGDCNCQQAHEHKKEVIPIDRHHVFCPF